MIVSRLKGRPPGRFSKLVIMLILMLILSLVAGCSQKSNKLESNEYTVFDISGEELNYFIISLADKKGNNFVLLSEKLRIHDLDTLTIHKKLILVDSIYRLKLTMLNERPKLEIMSTFIAPYLGAYYLHSGPDALPEDTGILFWKSGDILIDVYKSDDVIDLYMVLDD